MRRHILSVLFIFIAGFLNGLATPFTPRWEDVYVKHQWDSLPDNWANLGHPSADFTIDLHIGLNPQNENALIDALYDVSSPDHPKYGEHLSKEIVAPTPDALELVNAWLKHHGVLPPPFPVSRANNLLSASYQLYQHIGTNETVLRTLSYGLPEALLAYVQTVTPTTHFGFPRTSFQKPLMCRGRAAGAQPKVLAGELETVLSSRSERVMPAFLRWLYRISGYVPTAAKYNVVGIVGLLNDYPNPDDLRLFMNAYRDDATSATIGTTLGDPLINWLDFVLSRVTVPQTISSSYGKDEYKVPPDYAIYVCNPFEQLGARGASVLFASGNAGVGAGNCQFEDGFGNRVGGTTGYNPEVAASLSGGGFSAYIPRPRYRDYAVLPYLQNLGNQYYGLFNPGGRGIPDVTLQVINFDVVFKRQTWIVSGTSFAAPTAAGIISLLNDYRLMIGRRPLGFLNPWLYGGGLAGLNDITSGSNPGCNTNGFTASPGWDPVTGLGTLDFARLGEILSYR